MEMLLDLKNIFLGVYAKVRGRTNIRLSIIISVNHAITYRSQKSIYTVKNFLKKILKNIKL
jgi:hypothetical protein